MNRDDLITLIRERSRPLAPQPVAVASRALAGPPVRAVLFDVYGTLLVSAAGDIGSASPLSALIAQRHAAARQRGVDWPEVEIRALWRAAGIAEAEVERVAVEHELASNPVWPMPGFPAVPRALAERCVVGVVSNAQFYTPLTLEALAGDSLAKLGFASDLCLWSFEQGRAKPSVELYRAAARRLAARGIAPAETLMVGNSARKDVAPAQAAGFRAALFAGDQRSYDPAVGVQPDAVITDLSQLLDL